ncbi:MAG: HD domain-containing phosphohydrolase [Burkholderiaceae bacterium]
MSELEAGAGGAAANPHFLDHVVDAAEQQELQASEDIVAGNGMKLLAKGARISAALRERLLQHKLGKPLEESVQVVGGLGAQDLAPVADGLLQQHGLLRVLCAHEQAQPVAQSLARLNLSPPLLSLLSLYARLGEERLPHTVGVAALALALARKLLPGDIERHRQLAIAGLVHDIGELYIDPALLRRDAPLDASQWKHIATHPLVGYRVLRRLPGAGDAIAQAVLSHHERLDGFGYPRGLRDEQFPLGGQILAAAEWLMGLIESGSEPLAHASVASRLIPGEFSPALLELISASARDSRELREQASQPALAALDAMAPQLQRVSEGLGRFQASRAWLDERIAEAGPQLRMVLELGRQRMQRIQASFSSSGLDVHSPAQILQQLRDAPDARGQLELEVLVREFGWRLRELQREAMLRAGLLSAEESAVMQALIDRLNGVDGADAADAAYAGSQAGSEPAPD